MPLTPQDYIIYALRGWSRRKDRPSVAGASSGQPGRGSSGSSQAGRSRTAAAAAAAAAADPVATGSAPAAGRSPHLATPPVADQQGGKVGGHAPRAARRRVTDGSSGSGGGGGRPPARTRTRTRTPRSVGHAARPSERSGAYYSEQPAAQSHGAVVTGLGLAANAPHTSMRVRICLLAFLHSCKHLQVHMVCI
jgi:hypothetical protein